MVCVLKDNLFTVLNRYVSALTLRFKSVKYVSALTLRFKSVKYVSALTLCFKLVKYVSALTLRFKSVCIGFDFALRFRNLFFVDIALSLGFELISTSLNRYQFSTLNLNMPIWCQLLQL
ncbi:hypothetical protein RhiirC2_799678 [Rhizophagus irregularis]|uniref:Uncharacterized protein n=1 Tax=Rhizophagus irregularis TaxID=588596 RepID=A0A2N1M4L9_9GLOM|nr:hypothetical protein RhiirC2_799678 [Rhizophagus irregularis]